jgi:hypothetical protein
VWQADKRKFGWPVAAIRAPTQFERRLLHVTTQQEYKCFVRFQSM